MDKQTVVYPYNGTPLNNLKKKKEWTFAIKWMNNYFKWKSQAKPDLYFYKSK